MSHHFEPRKPSPSRVRALRAARAVAIVASLGAAGCSEMRELSRDSGTPVDQSVADQGAVDAAPGDASVSDSETLDLAVADSSLVDSSVLDLSVEDSSVPDLSVVDSSVADARADARTPDDPAYPCIFDEELDWECCTSMGFPAGCPVIGPFVPPSMNA